MAEKFLTMVSVNVSSIEGFCLRYGWRNGERVVLDNPMKTVEQTIKKEIFMKI